MNFCIQIRKFGHIKYIFISKVRQWNLKSRKMFVHIAIVTSKNYG
jgi:hypothetical protein